MNNYWDMPERPINPPDYDEPNIEDAYQDMLDFYVDRAPIVVDADGYWDFGDDLSWTNKIDTYADGIYGTVELEDPDFLHERVFEVLERPINDLGLAQGEYLLSCQVTLVYTISDVISWSDVFEDWDGNPSESREYDFSTADINFESDLSSASNIEVYPLS